MASPGPTPPTLSDLTVGSGRVRRARRLATRAFRSDTGEFLAEGPQAVRESLRTPAAALEVFATVAATDRHAALLRAAEVADVPWQVVEDDVLDSIADAVTPQGLVARCASVVGTLDDLPRSRRLVVVAHDMRDPGNAGAVIRVADAAGADAVVLTGDSVDPLNPKAVRASAGSVFHLPVVVHRDAEEVLGALDDLQILAADGGGGAGLFDADLELSRPSAWVLGNEARGLDPAVRGRADHVVAVPIFGSAESLNLATAAAVCLYASAREQRGGRHRS